MNQKDYPNKLAPYLNKASNKSQSIAEGAGQRDAPLNNFFGDDFLTMLYRSDTQVGTFSQIKELLNIVSNGDERRHHRADAAVNLGRFVQSRYRDTDYTFGNSSPKQWFSLARELNSVIGAFELAKVLLADQNLRVELDLATDPLPRLLDECVDSRRSNSNISSDISKAWYLGARVATRHRQREFSGWDDESFRCAFECIVNYISLPPSTRIVSGRRETVEVRRHALQWLKPLWNALIVAASERSHRPTKHRAALTEQQLTVLAWLDELERNPNAARRHVAAAPAAPGVNQITVIAGTIPVSSDKADNDYLKLFEVLRHPMEFKTLGSLDDLYQISATLQAEFPWATETIAVVMSELYARKRHGARRLGMTPMLLAGTPGTGKTRFAQRLSELLGTPSTVINLAGMADVKMLKGVTRGWASNRPSRMIEFIAQTSVPNPLFILDEIDKTGAGYVNGGDPQEALLDLLEPGNARRFQDIYLMTECNLSHCLYIATCNSLTALSAPLLSRLHPVIFPAPGPEHAETIAKGILRDLETSWGLPADTLSLTTFQLERMRGLSPREMRRATIETLAADELASAFALH